MTAIDLLKGLYYLSSRSLRNSSIPVPPAKDYHLIFFSPISWAPGRNVSAGSGVVLHRGSGGATDLLWRTPGPSDKSRRG